MKHIVIEAYAVKLVPSGCRADKCDFGLPIFVRNRTDAVNEAVRMLNHLNIRMTDGIIRYIGKYNVTGGALVAPLPSDVWESNLLDALESTLNLDKGGARHEEKK